MDDRDLEAAGVPKTQRSRLRSPEIMEHATREAEGAEELDCQLIWRTHDAWPTAFEQIPDPPFALWLRGDADVLHANGIAIVGPRAASPYGLHAAHHFATALTVAGLVVTSGLARGVDAVAHRAAVTAAVPTLAILGSGLERIYPSEHEVLTAQIIDAGGLVISEAPPLLKARPALFPRRNRLLVALSRAVLVIEASRRSGALLTAEWALAYDRPIWAVPGPYASPQSEGTHRLIRDGAYLADSPSGLVEDLGLVKGEDDAAGRFHSAEQAAVFEALLRRPQPLDALVSELRMPRSQILVALRELEVAQRIERDEGAGYRAL